MKIITTSIIDKKIEENIWKPNDHCYDTSFLETYLYIVRPVKLSNQLYIRTLMWLRNKMESYDK